MEPFEKDELSEQELDAMLPQWKSPPAPARLRAAVFPEKSVSWWRTLWTTSIRVPLPLAGCLAILLALGAWQWATVPPPRVEIRKERVEVPVVKHEVVTKTIYRDRIVRLSTAREPAAASNVNASELRPVAELRPRIIRRHNDEN